MISKKLALLVLLSSAAVALVTGVEAVRQNVQKGASKVSTPELTRGDVYDVAPEPTDVKEREHRKAKNKRYEKGGGTAKRLTELPPDTGSGRFEHSSGVPPLPVALSDSVVLGNVVKVQPYLTEAETSIYSEFTIAVEEVIKNAKDHSLSKGTSIIADREGGALRLPNGRVLRYEVAGIGQLPRLGSTYVLFLRTNNQGQDILILSGYEVRGGKVFSLKGRSPYEGVGVADFLAEVRLAVSRGGTQQ